MIRQVVGASGVARVRWLLLPTVAGLLVLAGAAIAAGTVRFDGSPGKGTPPAKLGGLSMEKFARDHRARLQLVTDVSGPTGKISFSRTVVHLVVKNKKGYWRTWSNGYRADVYFAPGTSITISLPTNTTAFYFYAEPDDPGTFKVTATASGTTSGPVKIVGAGGAKFFGFIAKGGAHLSTVTVSTNDKKRKKHKKRKALLGGFAVGEFAIHKG
jgi:hypothetical protein